MRTIFYKFLILLLLSFCQLSAQIPLVILRTIPEGYSILQLVKRDINEDEMEDYLIVAKMNGEDSLSSSVNPIARKVFLFLRENSTFRLRVVQDSAIYHYNYDENFKDAFVMVRTEPNGFAIEHYGGFRQRWGRTSTFIYDPLKQNWYLSEDVHSTWDNLREEGTLKEDSMTEKDFGRISFEDFSIYRNIHR